MRGAAREGCCVVQHGRARRAAIRSEPSFQCDLPEMRVTGTVSARSAVGMSGATRSKYWSAGVSAAPAECWGAMACHEDSHWGEDGGPPDDISASARTAPPCLSTLPYSIRGARPVACSVLILRVKPRTHRRTQLVVLQWVANEVPCRRRPLTVRPPLARSGREHCQGAGTQGGGQRALQGGKLSKGDRHIPPGTQHEKKYL